MKQKKALRLQMLNERSTLDKKWKENYDLAICEQLWVMIQERNFQTIHCYLPMGTEINIFPLIQKMLDNDKQVVTPKTLNNRKLEHRILLDLMTVEKGLFGTMHPSNTPLYQGEYDCIIVPALAFCKTGYRLGYGGGYYDTFLAQHPTTYQVGVAYPFQCFKEIPKEIHDAQLDEIMVSV